jgi:hypothetical protein
MLIERKFTLGEWMDSGVFVVDKKGETICLVSMHGRTKEKYEANAKLIAAAPLMLDALEAIHTMLEAENRLDTIIGDQIKNTIEIATK